MKFTGIPLLVTKHILAINSHCMAQNTPDCWGMHPFANLAARHVQTILFDCITQAKTFPGIFASSYLSDYLASFAFQWFDFQCQSNSKNVVWKKYHLCQLVSLFDLNMGDINIYLNIGVLSLSSLIVTEVMECLLKRAHRPVEMDRCGAEAPSWTSCSN